MMHNQQTARSVAPVIDDNHANAYPIAQAVALSLRMSARKYSDDLRPLSELVSLVLEPEVNPAKWRELLLVANERLDSFLSVIYHLDVPANSPQAFKAVARFVDDLTACLVGFSSICDESASRGPVALSERGAYFSDSYRGPFVSALRLILSGNADELATNAKSIGTDLQALIADLNDFSWLTVCAVHEKTQTASTFPAFQLISDAITLGNRLRIAVIKSALAIRATHFEGVSYGV